MKSTLIIQLLAAAIQIPFFPALASVGVFGFCIGMATSTALQMYYNHKYTIGEK